MTCFGLQHAGFELSLIPGRRLQTASRLELTRGVGILIYWLWRSLIWTRWGLVYNWRGWTSCFGPVENNASTKAIHALGSTLSVQARMEIRIASIFSGGGLILWLKSDCTKG